ncbi:MAG: hypothetical protein GWM90_03670 [Gemmatimonadetes bacterium]|nr:hypothetical protein [Gemmatimonadota bacterium]NIU77994.1 hypothetical protein [Gammaproteobacteria bacterium]NIX43248.1 hypothetical protein [Gemmatimonadota bacterium]
MLATVGCGAGRGPSEGTPVEPSTRVRVENHHWSDVTVYVLAGPAKRRLGLVVTTDVKVFELPESMLNGQGSVRLLVDPIGGGRRHITRPILVNEGEQIELEVQNHLPISTVMISDLGGHL